jgi:predicted PurR-regulated permease PerM
VLLPFFLAVVLAYVLAPVVEWMEKLSFGRTKDDEPRRLPRWVAVVLLYLALLGAITGFAVVGAPRLAAEVEKLARELPETVATVRDEWLPELERRVRGAMRGAADEAGNGSAEAGHRELDAVTGADPRPAEVSSIRITPIGAGGEGGYAIDLPEGGVVIEPEGERFRVVTGEPRHDRKPLDLTATLTETLNSMSDDTKQTAATLIKTARAVIRAVVKGVFTFFIMLMLSAYLLITNERILAFFRSLWPPRRRRNYDRLLKRIDRGLGGVVRGQLLIALVNGALSGVGFYLLELRYWPILTLIATLLSIIPIFGAILSTIPAVIIALQDGPTTALLTLGWIVLIHQIEANLLNPKIMGDAAKVHPVLVVFALLAGESLFGIAGALLAVPVLSITQSLFLHYREVMLGVPAPRSSPGTTKAPAK